MVIICEIQYDESTTELKLDDKYLTEFPLEVFTLINLEKLYLQNNKISVIPYISRFLKNLLI
jgi:Leucine-rich repeat (LRR) protein